MRMHPALAVATALTTAATVTAAAPAQAAGNRSLATVLAADGNTFDAKGRDFDVVDRAVRFVLAADAESPVAVLADGTTRVTAFLPTDGAFRRLVGDLTGTKPETEKEAWQTLRDAAGADTIEQVLLYHVVAGDTINSQEAAAADGAELTTAQGGTVTVEVTDDGIYLVDADEDDADPRLLGKLLDLNKGNRQIAHGMDRVLRPLDL